MLNLKMKHMKNLVVKTMDYNIKQLYTESLHVSSFKNLVKDEKIKLAIDLYTSLSKSEHYHIFKINYSVSALENPIYLNWVGIAILNINNNSENMNEDIFLEDKEIKKFINNAINNLSFFIGGELPQLDKITRSNHD